MVRKAAYPPSFRPIRNPCINLLQIYRLVRQLRSLEIGEQCLDLLSKNRHSCNLLAIFLWSSPGSMRLLLLVITSAYRPLVSNRLSERVVRRTCNAIGLFQTLASHPHTKMSFIRASMPEYLYAFLKTRSRERNYERLRLTIQKLLITFLPQKCFLVAYAAWKLAQHCQKQIRADLSGYIPWLLVDYKYVNIIRGDPEALCNLRRLIWLFGSGTGIQENLPVSHLDWSSDDEECNLLRTEIEKPKMAKKEVRKREIPERRGRV
ncbi:uncharacterized protein [Gossypium hirsutum]|uniref:Uncharacterized protein isoform X2 n=1 Tax=Gossypium hirsutum TaxID=3635 RepID=A0ABM3BZK1_GOSHI|nr:uncharacterized protein LOC107955643 isoform X2 [Gossypium hirsutum]